MAAAKTDAVVLAIGGHDPSGGAGLQADIEAIAANGGRAVTLVTALTAQNTSRFAHCSPVNDVDLVAQAELLLADIRVNAIKIGLIPTPRIAAAVGRIVRRQLDLPVILDPVLAAGVGTTIVDLPEIAALRELIRDVTVLTTNITEARQLTNSDDPRDAAAKMLDLGCKHVLITGTHADTPEVVNSLYSSAREMSWQWPRLPHVYHGAGCTLASALATWLARGMDIDSAATLAQEYTWRCLKGGVLLGHGHHHPTRIHPHDPSAAVR